MSNKPWDPFGSVARFQEFTNELRGRSPGPPPSGPLSSNTQTTGPDPRECVPERRESEREKVSVRR